MNFMVKSIRIEPNYDLVQRGDTRLRGLRFRALAVLDAEVFASAPGICGSATDTVMDPGPWVDVLSDTPEKAYARLMQKIGEIVCHLQVPEAEPSAHDAAPKPARFTRVPMAAPAVAGTPARWDDVRTTDEGVPSVMPRDGESQAELRELARAGEPVVALRWNPTKAPWLVRVNASSIWRTLARGLQTELCIENHSTKAQIQLHVDGLHAVIGPGGCMAFPADPDRTVQARLYQSPEALAGGHFDLTKKEG